MRVGGLGMGTEGEGLEVGRGRAGSPVRGG